MIRFLVKHKNYIIKTALKKLGQTIFRLKIPIVSTTFIKTKK
jgi:hypothetical protein